MRLVFGILILGMVPALCACALVARRSGKEMGKAASVLLASLLLPMAGNAIIILSSRRAFSLVGCYMYYLGLDVSIAALLHFTFTYCRISWSRKSARNLVYFLLLVDVVQLLLNPVFHHAFEITPVTVDGYDYYRMIPHFGQTFHRAVDYLILLGVIILFVVRLVRAPRLQAERYSVILFALVFVSVWETAYIFSGAPIDRSMVGFGVFGLLVFYFSIFHRPLRLLDRMLSSVVSGQQDPMYFFDDSQRCIWMNKSGRSFLKLREDETEEAGNRLEALFGPRHPGEAEWQDQLTLVLDGENHFLELSKVPLMDSRRAINGFYILLRDLSGERLEMEQKLYNARHDSLTGLYNRDYLYERTREYLNENPEDAFIILHAEISDLKLINDLYGNTFGDYALKYSASWIRNYLRDRGVYGRLGGDSFGICLPEKGFSQERLEQLLSDFLVSEGEAEYHMLIHIGLYRVSGRDTDTAVLYDRAHLALETIKADYHFNIAWYDDSLRSQAVRNRQVSVELGPALKDHQLRPWLQPIVDSSGRTVGAEALVRWAHPEEGLRQPSAFIPVFEKNGMIADVDRSVWRQSCEILSRWKQEGRNLFLSVNISPKDFLLIDVVAELKSLVDEFALDPSVLRLEITESLMMNGQEDQLSVVQTLREAGFCVEMDDFGSGYSSLNLLREMPVDVLKVDMAFLRQAESNPRALIIMRQVVTLARELGITSLTEGVETEQQFRSLAEMGFELYQGYYFARPMPVEEFEQYLSAPGN